MAEFFDMGGYGIWIWPCWGITAAMMIGLLWQSRRQEHKMRSEAERLKLLRRQGRRKRQAKSEGENVNEAASGA